MKSKIKEIIICGKKVKLGDYVEVEYKGADGGGIKGKIVKFATIEFDGFLQAELENGWAFHDYDIIKKHIASNENI